MYTAEEWPIAVNMLSFGGSTPAGTALRDADTEVWDSQLKQVADLGARQIDPTDAWVPLAELSDNRLQEFKSVLEGRGLSIPSISMTRSSVLDEKNGEKNLADAHKLIDIAPEFGATIVNVGFMQKLTAEQENHIWFWHAQGHVDKPENRDKAISLIRELSDHAAENGIQLSLEMYEDTFIGTPDLAVQFVEDVDRDAVGLNPDLGNLIRLHQEIPPYEEMFEKVLPYSNFWHIKNYSRDFDPKTGAYSTFPMPLKYGFVNYRKIINRALDYGYSGPFCCEHYGSDSLGVCVENSEYIRQVLASRLS